MLCRATAPTHSLDGRGKKPEFDSSPQVLPIPSRSSSYICDLLRGRERHESFEQRLRSSDIGIEQNQRPHFLSLLEQSPCHFERHITSERIAAQVIGALGMRGS